MAARLLSRPTWRPRVGADSSSAPAPLTRHAAALFPAGQSRPAFQRGIFAACHLPRYKIRPEKSGKSFHGGRPLILLETTATIRQFYTDCHLISYRHQTGRNLQRPTPAARHCAPAHYPARPPRHSSRPGIQRAARVPPSRRARMRPRLARRRKPKKVERGKRGKKFKIGVAIVASLWYN